MVLDWTVMSRRVALIDSGCGLLPTAGWLRHLRPDLALDLYLDPEGMPWGSKPSDWIVDRVVGTGRLAVARGADAIVVPCNTASVTAVVPLRAARDVDEVTEWVAGATDDVPKTDRKSVV